MVSADRNFDDLTPPNGDGRRPLIGVALLPSMATLGNMLCGFLAIMCCLLSMREEYHGMPPRIGNAHLAALFPTYIAVGAYLIVASMIFDALDGRLARIARQTSEFGAQLDSVADIVSFGAAPAMLLITLFIRLVEPNEGDPLVSKLLWRIGLLGSIVYVSGGAVRLARYNAENVKDESGQKKFSGLPVPGAAAGMIALIILHEDLRTTGPILGINWAFWLRWVMAPTAFALGILMVSRLNYVHVFNTYVRREQPPLHLVWLLAAAIVGLFFIPQVTLVAAAYAYVLSGIVRGFLTWRRRGRAERPEETADKPVRSRRDE